MVAFISYASFYYFAPAQPASSFTAFPAEAHDVLQPLENVESLMLYPNPAKVLISSELLSSERKGSRDLDPSGTWRYFRK